MSFLQFQALRPFTATSLRLQTAVIEQCRAYSSPSGNTSEAEDLAVAREWFQTFSKSTIPAKAAETSYSRSSGPGGQKTNKTSSKATVQWPLHTLLKHIPKVLHQGIRDSRYYVQSSDAINIQCDSGRNQSDNKEECHDRLYDEIKQIYKNRIPGVTSPEQKKRIDALKENVIPHDSRARRIYSLDTKAVKKLQYQALRDRETKKKLVQTEKFGQLIEAEETPEEEACSQCKGSWKIFEEIDSSTFDKSLTKFMHYLPAFYRKKSDNAARLKMKKMHGDKKRARSGGG